MQSSIFKMFLLVVMLFSNYVSALPRFAVKLQDRCIDCHFNPSGGIVRNLNGWHWGKNNLSMISPRDKDFSMSPKISDNIIIGIDFRSQLLYSQNKSKMDFQNMSGSIYTALSVSSQINILGKYDFVNRIYEGYAIAHILPNNSYIKAGAFTPNFGIRIDDHTAYTRGGNFGLLFSQGVYQGLIYNPFYTEAGVEVGVYGSDFLFATASVGSNLLSNSTLTKDPSYTARLELTPSFDKFGLLFGASYAAVKTPTSVNMFGGFFGFGYDEFSLLAEYDIADGIINPDQKTKVLMIESSYGLLTGLDAVVRFDRIDPNPDVESDEISQVVAGFEFQPYSFIEVRPQYRLVMDAANKDAKNDSFVLQFYFWY